MQNKSPLCFCFHYSWTNIHFHVALEELWAFGIRQTRWGINEASNINNTYYFPRLVFSFFREINILGQSNVLCHFLYITCFNRELVLWLLLSIRNHICSLFHEARQVREFLKGLKYLINFQIMKCLIFFITFLLFPYR